MNETTDELGNNAAERLKGVVERWSRLLDEIGDLQEDLKQVKAEAKADGYDMKALAQVVKELRQDEDYRAAQLELHAVINTYRRAVELPTDLDEAYSAARDAASEVATATQRRKASAVSEAEA